MMLVYTIKQHESSYEILDDFVICTNDVSILYGATSLVLDGLTSPRLEHQF